MDLLIAGEVSNFDLISTIDDCTNFLLIFVTTTKPILIILQRFIAMGYAAAWVADSDSVRDYDP